MARYELGAVYQFTDSDEKKYYVRLLERDSYGVFAPFEGEVCEEVLSNTPYQLYFSCNSYAVKRGVWEKVLSSPNVKDTMRWKPPKLANYANFDPVLSLEQHRVFFEGNLYECDKNEFIQLVKDGMIKNIFSRHEVIPSFLSNYYEEWPNSYILEKIHILSGTTEYQKEKLEVLNEMGFDTTSLTTQ